MLQLVLMLVGEDDPRVPAHNEFASCALTSTLEVPAVLAQAKLAVEAELRRLGSSADTDALEQAVADAWSD